MFVPGSSGIEIVPTVPVVSSKVDKLFRIASTDPTPSINPPQLGVLWINGVTGEEFICIDNTKNKNVWKSNRGRVIAPPDLPLLDILGDSSCIALWRFDSNANEASGKFDGKWTGEEIYVYDGWNQAAFLNGASYINIGKPVNPLKEWSVSLWVNTIQTAVGDDYWTNPTLVAMATAGPTRDIGIALSNGRLHIWSGNCAKGDKYKTTEFFIANGKWHHIVVTVQNGQITYYVDKLQKGVFPDVCYDHLDDADFYVGVTYHTGDNNPIKPTSFFIGKIDNLRFFNKVLTLNDVETIFDIENPYQGR